MTDLFWSGHEVNGSVIVVILLKQTEGELVVNQKVVCSKCPKTLQLKLLLHSLVQHNISIIKGFSSMIH